MPENCDIPTINAEIDNDLEDGEIREELEDVSDCSLSEILSIKEDLNNDPDTELLREEAMKSLHPEKDEVTEEELYRLEALKSLLVNLESANNCEVKFVGKSPEKKRRKRKKKTKEKLQADKRRKLIVVKEKKDEGCLIPALKVEVADKNESNFQNHQSRPWYPRYEFALLSAFHVEDMKQPKVKCRSEMKLKLEAKCESDVENIVPVHVAQPVKSVIIDQPNHPKPIAVAISQFQSQFKRITKHSIRKIDFTLPAINKFTLNKSGKYKLVHASKKTHVGNDTPAKSAVFNSKYSIIRKQTHLPRINPRDFMIKLNDDDDSGNENEADLLTSCDVTKEGDESTICRCCDEMASSFSDNTESSLPFVIDTNPDSLEYSGQKSNLFSCLNDSDKAFKGLTLPNIGGPNLKTEKILTLAQKKLPKDLPSTQDRKTKTVNEINNGNIDKSKSNLLKDAETNLIKIRARLLSDMVELEDAIKKNTIEETKLNNMMKKLIALKSMVLKFEKRITVQKSKLMLSSKSMYLLFKGVEVRSGTCSQIKEICIRAGKGTVGPDYRPPDEYENMIRKQRSAIDFSKYTSLNANK